MLWLFPIAFLPLGIAADASTLSMVTAADGSMAMLQKATVRSVTKHSTAPARQHQRGSGWWSSLMGQSDKEEEKPEPVEAEQTFNHKAASKELRELEEEADEDAHAKEEIENTVEELENIKAGEVNANEVSENTAEELEDTKAGDKNEEVEENVQPKPDHLSENEGNTEEVKESSQPQADHLSEDDVAERELSASSSDTTGDESNAKEDQYKRWKKSNTALETEEQSTNTSEEKKTEQPAEKNTHVEDEAVESKHAAKVSNKLDKKTLHFHSRKKAAVSGLGNTSALDDGGFKRVAKLQDKAQMTRFVERALQKVGLLVSSDTGLEKFVVLCIDGKGPDSFDGLTKEFYNSAAREKDSWVCVVKPGTSEYNDIEHKAFLALAHPSLGPGLTASLDEEGYVAASQNTEKSTEMDVFMHRVCNHLGLEVRNLWGLLGTVPFYSGAKAKQSFAALSEEVLGKSLLPGEWVTVAKQAD